MENNNDIEEIEFDFRSKDDPMTRMIDKVVHGVYQESDGIIEDVFETVLGVESDPIIPLTEDDNKRLRHRLQSEGIIEKD